MLGIIFIFAIYAYSVELVKRTYGHPYEDLYFISTLLLFICCSAGYLYSEYQKEKKLNRDWEIR